MSVPVFIGDEVSSSGYRLAGLRVSVPSEDEVMTAIHAACNQAPLVLVSAAFAQRLPQAELDELLSQVTPPVIIVPDLLGHASMPDLAIRIRQQLGVLE